MYLSALEFLEEERQAFRPFEALAGVPDERMDSPIEAAHGWSARNLIAHMVAWQAAALDMARELAVGEASASKARLDAMTHEQVDAQNAAISADWGLLPLDEVRRRIATVPGELRGYLTVVPEARWVKHASNLQSFIEETIDHYADHVADLEAILEASG